MAPTLSVTMALTALEEQVTTVNDAELHLTRQRQIRDDLIRDARENNIPFRTLVKITGLSRDRLYTIVNAPRSEPSFYTD